MNRAAALAINSLLAAGGLAAGAAAPVPPAAPAEKIIELPPMIISETRDPIAWHYATVRGDEYLSSLSARATRTFIEEHERALHRLHAIVPEEFLANPTAITILLDKTQEPKSGDTIGRDVLGTDQAPATAVRFLPNLRIDGRDVSVTCAYLDEVTLPEMEISISASLLRFQLERRAPMLPPWLIEGFLVLRQQAIGQSEPVTLRPLFWLSPAESQAIGRDPARPRALLPANEMFAPDALRGDGDHDPKRVRTLRFQVGLFVRWALDPRNGVREAFLDFARRAAEQRVTEELFSRCFGFGFSDLRDRLNDYLPLAVREPLPLAPDAHPPLPSFEVRDASALQIARLRGTWERLEVGYVQKIQPSFAGRYLTQARATLQRPYERGANDPWLLAEIGLCEIEAGATTEALKFLEPAIAAGVIRPAACYEVARVRFAELLRGQPAGRVFSAAELAPILDPLRQALPQTPQLPEVYGLLADAWLRSREPAPKTDVDALVRGANDFALNPAVSYRLALALARCGRPTEAAALLATGIDYVTDEATRTRYAQLHAALTK